MVILKSDHISTDDVDQIVKVCNKLEFGLTFSANDLNVQMLENGSINNIYHVQVTRSDSLPTTVPLSFVVKLFTSQSKLPYDISNSRVTNLVLGQSGLGPKIYLILEDALVMEFVVGRIINLYDDQQAGYRKAVAQKLAHFHSQRIPIEHNEQQKYVHHIFERWLTEKIWTSLESGFMAECLTKFECSTLTDLDKFKSEVEYVKQSILDAEDHVMVFAHNDFNHSNIIVVEDLDEKEVEENEFRIKLVDFDFSRYFYRGADFGRYFVDYRNPEIDESEEEPDAPGITDEIMLEYIEYYREECSRIYGEAYLEKHENSSQKILKEAKLFMLFSCMMNIVYALWVASFDDDDTRDGCMIWADMCFAQYLRMKSRFQAEKSVP